MAMSFAHCALQLAPSAVVGLKVLPAAHPVIRTQRANIGIDNFTILPFMVVIKKNDLYALAIWVNCICGLVV